MDWTDKKREEAERVLRKWYTQVAGDETTVPPAEAVDLLADDLNSHGVLTLCHRLSGENDVAGLRGALVLLGLLGDKIPDWAVEQAYDLTDVEAFLSDARVTAMETKDFAEVDRIKTALTALGIEVQMSKDGVKLKAPPGFDGTGLEGVL
jgi:cysteinyl-tRNA synthetase